MRFATLREWLSWQEGLHPRAIDLGLARVREVASRLGVLQFSCPVFTVGGTNGKGSCVALLESMLRAGGYRVGAFTSPHLFRYNERIRIDGRLASDEEIVGAFERIDDARGDVSLTFFEFNALAALVLFKDAQLDAIVLEVGLGGRLDAVNIIDADVALIASIGLDHCDWLGSTVEEIGREKAGVFRKGKVAIFGGSEMPESIRAVAEQVGARLLAAGEDYEIDLRGLPAPGLRGGRQIGNAAAVIAALSEVSDRLPLSREQIAEGLRNARLRGRFEVVGKEPQWIFDVAHNPDAAGELAAELARSACEGRTIAVVGILKDKDAPSVVAKLLPVVDVWIAAGLEGERGSTARELVERVGSAASGWMLADNVVAACKRAAEIACAADRIVVFGSFHTVGPAVEWLETATLGSAAS